jgi:hypothetical protein
MIKTTTKVMIPHNIGIDTIQARQYQFTLIFVIALSGLVLISVYFLLLLWLMVVPIT